MLWNKKCCQGSVRDCSYFPIGVLLAESRGPNWSFGIASKLLEIRTECLPSKIRCFYLWSSLFCLLFRFVFKTLNNKYQQGGPNNRRSNTGLAGFNSDRSISLTAFSMNVFYCEDKPCDGLILHPGRPAVCLINFKDLHRPQSFIRLKLASFLRNSPSFANPKHHCFVYNNLTPVFHINHVNPVQTLIY